MITFVGNGVSRGPRPEPADFAAIKAEFATVLSLEGADEDVKEILELQPVRIISRPISPWQIYVTGISQEALAAILQFIEVEPKPLLVHCQHGQDRTGLVIAAYRVAVCKWPKQVAMAEALSFGYRKLINFGLNKTWEKFNGS
jgi:hypothetical protein